MNKPLIVVTGATGQLGQTLANLWDNSALANQFEILALDRSNLDFAQLDVVETTLSKLNPAVIINAAAYTKVDMAESEKDSAFLINDVAVAALASWVVENNAKLIHISTDFVFDGSSNRPYLPDQPTAPLGVYGQSKLAGERKIQNISNDSSAVIRTSWLYSEHGNNFVKTMLRLLKEKDKLSVVNDQIGSPTSTHGLAELIFAMIRKGQYQGVYQWNDGGSISWFDFAEKIQQLALLHGLLDRKIPITAITTDEYPTPAKRPAYSVLNRSRVLNEFNCPDLDWEQQLEVVIKEIAASNR